LREAAHAAHRHSQARDHIRELNDAFRTCFNPALERNVLSAGLSSLPSDMRATAIRKTAACDPSTNSISMID
jgi:hypothetical protein